MKRITYFAALTASALLFLNQAAARDYTDLYKGLEKEITTVTDPAIPPLRISIAEVGGRGDGICLKGGSGEKGLKSGPCRDILVCNCKVLRAHGGFVMGSDISGGAENIFVRDCVFDGTDVGLRFKSAIGRGGHTSDIFINDIVMVGIRGAAIEFSCNYADITYKNNSASDVRDMAFAPDFADMDIRRITCRECKWAVSAKGIPGIKAVHDIRISDCTFLHNGKEAFDIDKETADIGISDTRCHSFDY